MRHALPSRAAAPDAAAALRVNPRPLILGERKLVIAWSTKSACSHVVVWAFLHEGLLRAASYFHAWPHKFRQQVYYPSAAYRRHAAAVAAGGGAGYTLVKVTRDPALRLVSVFRHVCRYDFLWAEIERTTGVRVARDGLSLADFDRFLAGQALALPSAADPHVAAQAHPVAALGFDRTITLNIDTHSLEAGLNAVERDLGMAVTDFAGVPALARLRAGHYAREAPAPPGAIETHRFRADAIAAFPKAALAASPLLAAMAARHYPGDAEYARTGDTAGAIAFA